MAHVHGEYDEDAELILEFSFSEFLDYFFWMCGLHSFSMVPCRFLGLIFTSKAAGKNICIYIYIHIYIYIGKFNASVSLCLENKKAGGWEE